MLHMATIQSIADDESVGFNHVRGELSPVDEDNYSPRNLLCPPVPDTVPEFPMCDMFPAGLMNTTLGNLDSKIKAPKIPRKSNRRASKGAKKSKTNTAARPNQEPFQDEDKKFNIDSRPSDSESPANPEQFLKSLNVMGVAHNRNYRKLSVDHKNRTLKATMSPFITKEGLIDTYNTPAPEDGKYFGLKIKLN